MERWLHRVLGALAAGVAVSAFTRRRPEGDTVASPPAAEPAVESSPGADEVPTPRRVPTLLAVVTGRLREHNTVMIAASLAYYAMLSIFPAGIAAVSIYGLLFEPADLESQLTDLTEALPDDAASVIGGQLESIVDASSTGLGIVTTIGILVALWSASAGTKALMSGINIAYGIAETRRFFLLRGIALVITLGAVVFIASSIALVTFLPDLLVDLGLATGWARSVTILRWPGIFFFVVLGLGVLYKVAPNRPARNIPFLTPGAGIAAALWLVATVGLSFYANNLGSFNETYGTLGGVIVLLLWFFLSGLMILLGAELNDELEERKKLGVAA